MNGTIKAGAYSIDITPPVGLQTVGNFGEAIATSISDPLYANVLLIDDGETEVVLSSVDVCDFPVEVYHYIASEISRKCSIPKGNILLTPTHTHTACNIGQKGFSFQKTDMEYAKCTWDKIVTAAVIAQQRKVDVSVSIGSGINSDFTFNRRLVRDDGTVAMNWISPENLTDAHQAGPVDPEMHLLRFDDTYGNPICFFINFSMHNNSFPNVTTVSADMAGIMRDILKHQYGKELVVLFTPGTEGNINWVDYSLSLEQKYNANNYKRFGKSMAGTVLQIDAKLNKVPLSKIKCVQAWLEIKERPASDIDITPDRTFGDPDDIEAKGFWEQFIKNYEETNDRPLRSYSVPVSVVKLGDKIAFAATPCETFVEFGLDFKKRAREAGFPYSFMFGLTNGHLGYLPTKDAYYKGGYEIRKFDSNSFLERDAGERMVDEAVRLLK